MLPRRLLGPDGTLAVPLAQSPAHVNGVNMADDTEAVSAATPAPTPAPTPAVGTDAHSAAASILGYAYQVRSGLLELLRAKRPDMLMSIEMHDDIAWEDSTGEVTALLQYKLHQNREGHLSNYSDDLWRTLKVWLDRPQAADLHGPELWMVTTAVAEEGSIAAMLRAGDTRNDAAAVVALEAVATTSDNKATRKSREKFLALAPPERSAFVSRIVIADGSGDLAALEADVAAELRTAAPYDQVEAYLEAVWAWWNGVSLRYLQGLREPISVQETLMALTRIRNTFTDGKLPPLVSRAEIDIAKVMTNHADRLYVHQLRCVDIPEPTLAKAVMDYERAYLQADRWVERHMVDYAQLEEFSEELLDEWERSFFFMCDNLPTDSSDEDKKFAGRALLRELEKSTIALAGFDQTFFARGQRHCLAEEERVGWHPDFQTHLEQFLLGA